VEIVINQSPGPILFTAATRLLPLGQSLTGATEESNKNAPVWDKTVYEFAEDLLAACKHMQDNCLGLAANQIWEGEAPYPSMFCMRWPDENFTKWDWRIIINPSMQPTGKKEKVLEGCLSLMHPRPIQKKKLRKINVTLEYQTLSSPIIQTRRFMGISGIWSRIVQHECDHLAGQLCIK
jgi:peptide deformylase